MTNEMHASSTGPVVQARDISGGLHLLAPAVQPARMPAQLPSPGTFVNRRRELAVLERIVAEPATGGPRLVVLTGPGGVGKTSLALAWLHQIVPRYEGHLHVDLRGSSPGAPLLPAEPLERFLRALGTAEAMMPLDADERAAHFRSLVAGRRLIILLDNAASAAQVRPLLPGVGPALVVVTSRRPITGLLTAGARFVDVEPFGEDGAVDLLRHFAGPDRVAGEPEHARELVRLCGRLPLAVSVCGARLAARSSWPLARLVADLIAQTRTLTAPHPEDNDLMDHDHDHDPDEVVGDGVSVMAALTASYRDLGDAAAKAYRLLGVHPGDDIAPAAAAALFEVSAERAEDLLGRLVDARLVAESAQGRYRLLDLVRVHAGAQHDRISANPVGDRGAAVARLGRHYLRTATAAARMLTPARRLLAPPPAPEPADPSAGSAAGFADRAAARGWLEAEQDTIAAVIEAASTHRLHRLTWHLAEMLWPLFLECKRGHLWSRLYLTAFRAARDCGDTTAAAVMAASLGTALRSRRCLEAARTWYGKALTLADQSGDRLTRASAFEGLGLLDLDEGEPDAAARRFLHARSLHQELDRPRGVALMTRHLGCVAADLGDHQHAISHYTDALTYFAATPSEQYHQVRTLTFLGYSHLATGHLTPAAEVFEQAARIADAEGYRYEHGRALRGLADVAARDGDHATERQLLQTALEIFRDLGGLDEQTSVQRRLDELQHL